MFVRYKWQKPAAALLIILIPLLIHSEEIPQFTIMTEQWPPYNFAEDDSLKGISVEVLDHLLKMSGSTQGSSDIEIYPWPRAYKTIQEEENTILFTMARTAEREDLFKWVGPIEVQEFNIYALKSKELKIESVDDLSDYNFVTLKDDAEEELLVELTDLTYDDFFRANSVQHVIKLVAAGRYDMMVMLSSTIDRLSGEIGIDPDVFEPVYVLNKLELYYAFNKDTDDSLIEIFQKHLDYLKEKGVVDKIIDSYN